VPPGTVEENISMQGRLIAWPAALGAIAGLIYGWRRTKAPYERARAVLHDPVVIRPVRRKAIALQKGYRLAGATIGGIMGASGGLAVGLLVSALARSPGWKVGKGKGRFSPAREKAPALNLP
jgi:hypothetical protein